MHRLFALRARLRGSAGHVRADHRQPRLCLHRLSRARRKISSAPNASPAAPACRPARPRRSMEKTVIEAGQPEHSVVTTCAYCGVGCSFKAEMRGTEVVNMVPYKDGQANHGHSCVKGRFAWGYTTHHGPHHQADDPRQDHRPLEGSAAGKRRSITPRPSSSASRRNTAARRSAASPRRAAPMKKPIWCRS